VAQQIVDVYSFVSICQMIWKGLKLKIFCTFFIHRWKPRKLNNGCQGSDRDHNCSFYWFLRLFDLFCNNQFQLEQIPGSKKQSKKYFLQNPQRKKKKRNFVIPKKSEKKIS
jgi:hypothetical protein